MIIMRHAVVRLVPAAISVCVTVTLIVMLGRSRYGMLSLLLATASLLNSILFRCSRDLIVFRNPLGLKDSDLGNLWIVGLFFAPLVVLALAVVGQVTYAGAAAVCIYLLGQSLFERETEYLRSAIKLRDFMVVACARPLWSLLGIGLMWPLRNQEWMPLAMFFIVAISPIMACLPRWKDIGPRLNWSWRTSVSGAIRIMPIGVMISIPVAYLFISDSSIKILLGHIMDPAVFGKYASCDDLIMPASWVAIGAFAWDLVPRLVKSPATEWAQVLLTRSYPIVAILIVVLMGVAFVPNIRISNVSLDMHLYFSLGFSNLAAATLSCVILPSLIAMGHRYMALIIALMAITLILFLIGAGGGLTLSFLEHASGVAELLACVHAAAVICGGILVYASVKAKAVMTQQTMV